MSAPSLSTAQRASIGFIFTFVFARVSRLKLAITTTTVSQLNAVLAFCSSVSAANWNPPMIAVQFRPTGAISTTATVHAKETWCVKGLRRSPASLAE